MESIINVEENLQESEITEVNELPRNNQKVDFDNLFADVKNKNILIQCKIL